jgi:glycosyltransferase involved in cell wall biosynthesis
MPPMNILWVNAEMPHPDRVPLLRELNREHPIIYLTFDGDHIDPAASSQTAECCSALVRVPKPTATSGPASVFRELANHARSPLPYAVWKCRSDAMQQKIEVIVRDESIDVVVTDSLAASANIPAQLPVPVILLEPRIEALCWYRRTVSATRFLRKRYYQRQWYRMYAYERSQCHRCDHVIAVAPEDLAWITVEYGVRHASLLHPGVDIERFRPSAGSRAEAGHVVVIASADSSPNEEDSAAYFVTEILPRLPDSAAGLRVTIVCRAATPGLQVVSRLDPRVDLVSDSDLRSWLERAGAVVVPRRIGGGPRSEILEAMAMEKPVVATTVGVGALPVCDGKHLLIADTPEELAAALAHTLDDPAIASGLARCGAELVRSELTCRHAASRLAATCKSISGASSGNLRAGAPSGSLTLMVKGR